MDELDWLAERFEEDRSHLIAVAYRMLGSQSDADDAVQEAWLRLSRSGGEGVENLGGWLTTVVARVSLDMLRSRRSRRAARDAYASEPTVGGTGAADPEREALLAESIGPALLVVLDALAPAERVAFVLHDMFDVPFDEIAPIVGRSPEAARQLASRARRRVRGAPTEPDADRARQRAIVDAFLAASRGGDLEALLAVLDPDVVLTADGAAVEAGTPPEVHGAKAVAEVFIGRAAAARPALVDGAPGLAWAPGGVPRAVFGFTTRDGKVVAIDLVTEPERVARLDVVIDEA